MQAHKSHKIEGASNRIPVTKMPELLKLDATARTLGIRRADIARATGVPPNVIMWAFTTGASKRAVQVRQIVGTYLAKLMREQRRAA